MDPTRYVNKPTPGRAVRTSLTLIMRVSAEIRYWTAAMLAGSTVGDTASQKE